MDIEALIERECEELRAMLLDKNRKYGNSAIDPVRIFSKADPIEQINVRIDDKLSRIRSGQSDDTEDTELLQIVLLAYWPLIKDVRVVPWTARQEGEKIVITHDLNKP